MRFRTVATALNSLAACTCQDFITGAFKFTLPESKGALWAKWISILYGALSFGLVSNSEVLIIFLLRIIAGVYRGTTWQRDSSSHQLQRNGRRRHTGFIFFRNVFSMGQLKGTSILSPPPYNFKTSLLQGAIFGGTVALSLVLWMGLGQQVAVASGTYSFPIKPVNVDTCPCLNSTNPETHISQLKSK